MPLRKRKGSPNKQEVANFIALKEMGVGMRAIVQRTGRNYTTVKKYLEAEEYNNVEIRGIVEKIKAGELNDLLLLNQKARMNLHKRFDEGSPNVIESLATMDKSFQQVRLIEGKSTQNICYAEITAEMKKLEKEIEELEREEREREEKERVITEEITV